VGEITFGAMSGEGSNNLGNLCQLKQYIALAWHRTAGTRLCGCIAIGMYGVKPGAFTKDANRVLAEVVAGDELLGKYLWASILQYSTTHVFLGSAASADRAFLGHHTAF